ncbi:putative reverse transcriptase, RNA-dependent DNA polymerase [Tanacetum coccineum]
MAKREDKEAIEKVKGKTLKEEKDPRAFLFPIRLEGKIDENALVDTGLDINTMPYRIYTELGRHDIKREKRGMTMIDYTEAEPMGVPHDVLCQVGFTSLTAKFLILDIPIDRDTPIVVGHGFLKTLKGTIDTSNLIFLVNDGEFHQTFRATQTGVVRIAESDSDDEEEYVIERNSFGTPIYNQKPRTYLNRNNQAEMPLEHLNWKPKYKDCYNNPEEAKGQWKTEIRLVDPYGNIYPQAFKTKPTNRKLSRYHRLGLYQAVELDEEDIKMVMQMLHRKLRVLTDDVLRSLSTPTYYRDLDTTTLRELIDSEDRLILEDPQPGVPRVGIPRPSRASMQDLYDRMGRMEI